MKAQSPNYWTAREFPNLNLKLSHLPSHPVVGYERKDLIFSTIFVVIVSQVPSLLPP